MAQVAVLAGNLHDDEKVDLFANSRYLIYKLSSMGVWIE